MLSGRFAPSPTGPLHMGSMVTALASYLDIKQRNGLWLVRIDDLDPPRQDPHAIPAILTSLTAHGLLSDRPIDHQSDHQQRYQSYWQKLAAELFYCNCARKMIAEFDTYPGYCRQYRTPRDNCAVRLRIQAEHADISYEDGISGHQQTNLTEQYGDFIVKRRDRLWAYNFATAVDDGLDFSDILRGQDLAPVTAPQMYIMDRLRLQRPDYCHIPVLCYADGTKLSKQTGAPALDNSRATDNLRIALTLLGQQPPGQQSHWHVQDWLNWAVAHWQRENIPAELAAFGAV